MTRLLWGDIRPFEIGVDRGVFYPKSGTGVAWNGLVSVTESTDGTTQTVTYFDGQQVQSQLTMGSFQATLEAFTYPDELEDYLDQVRNRFDFTYRTLVGLDQGYKIHLVYNALAASSNSSSQTTTTESELKAFSWPISTEPRAFPGCRPSSHLVIDSTKCYSWALETLENLLYGTEETPPRFPSPGEIIALFEDASILKITNHGDGTWTADGPDDVVYMLDATTFEISWPSVVYLNADTYTVRTL